MKERGAQFNGSTWVDRTNYFETLPASDENLEFAIRLEADRMVNSPIKAEDLATEFSVVRNEFEAGENSPERVLSQRMMAVAYEWHNYGKSTIGNRSDIERVPVDNLRAFYKKFYQPDNAVLVVAGKFDEKKHLNISRSTLARLPKPDRKLPETYTEEPPQDGERFVTLRRVGDVGLVGLLYHVPAASHAEFPAVEILADILELRALGPALQGPGRDQEGHERLGRRERVPRPGHDRDHGRGQHQGPGGPGKGPRRHALGARRGGPIRCHAGGSGSRPPDESSRTASWPRPIPTASPSSSASGPRRATGGSTSSTATGSSRSRPRRSRRSPRSTSRPATGPSASSSRPPSPSGRRSRRCPTSPSSSMATPAARSRRLRARRSTSRRWPSRPGVQRPEPIGGSSSRSCPRKPRRVGPAAADPALRQRREPKGLTEAAGFLPELMTRGTKNLTRQQIQDALDKNFARLGTGMGGMRMHAGIRRPWRWAASPSRSRPSASNLAAGLEILRQILREPTLPEASSR